MVLRRMFSFLAAVLACSFKISLVCAAEITAVPGTDPPTIVVRGQLEAGDQQKFIKLALPLDHATVAFDSQGGNLGAGIEIGRSIRLKLFDTRVTKDTYCASACALAWLGGINRYMDPTSRVGFHAAYVVENGQAKTSGSGNALVGAYLNQLGLGLSAIVYLSNADPESMQWLTANDANKYGIQVQLINQEPTTASLPAAVPSTHPDRPNWTIIAGIDLFGHDFGDQPKTTETAEVCETQCAHRTGCRAYTFNKDNYACFLKTDVETVFRNDIAVSGYEDDLAEKMRYSPFVVRSSTDFKGHDLAMHANRTFEQCAIDCERQDKCNGFSYVERIHQCWLKTEIDDGSFGEGITSGILETYSSIEPITGTGHKFIYERLPSEQESPTVPGYMKNEPGFFERLLRIPPAKVGQ